MKTTLKKRLVGGVLTRSMLARFLPRAVSLTLSVALTLGIASPMAAALTVGDLEAHIPMTDEQPIVNIQTNAVIDDFGNLTGYVEVGVKVKTPVATAQVTHYWDGPNGTGNEVPANDPSVQSTTVTNDPFPQTFRYVGVSLQYNAKILTPVTWTDDSGNTADIVLTGTTKNSYVTQVQFPTLKSKAITSAIAHVSGPDANDSALTAPAGTPATGLFYLIAEVTKPVELDSETLLGVVRFKYTTPDAATKAGNGAVGYDLNLASTGTPWVGIYDNNAAVDPNTWTTNTNKFPTTSDDWLIRLAPDAVINDSNVDSNFLDQQLYYGSGSNEFYYNTEVANATTTLPTPESLYVEPVDGTDPDPDTYANGLNDAAYIAARLTYLRHNILTLDQTNGTFNFTFVNDKTFDNSSGLGLGDLTTIVYVDWDNTILGTQIVPKNTDVRKLVNDHVAENFIYHDPAVSTDTLVPDTLAKIKSLDRVDTYRGKYPATGPALDATDYKSDPTTDDYRLDTGHNGIKGSAYPLTNKLDYVFFKRPMEHNTAEPQAADYATGDYTTNGALNPDYIRDHDFWTANGWVGWIQKSSSGGTVAEYDTQYPLAYGWALCTVDDYVNTWTTLGSYGELENYAIDGSGFSTVQYDGMDDTVNFKFADLKSGLTDDTVFLKAIYEPGTELLGTSFKYRVITEPYYTKLNAESAAAGGAISATFTLERSSTELADSFVRGVSRTREPVVRQAVTTDSLWEENATLGVNHNLPSPTLSQAKAYSKSTFIEVGVENGEEIVVSLSLSPRMNKIDYTFEDNYQRNFVGGNGRTLANFTRMTSADDKGDWIPDNYNYYVAGESYENDMWYDAPYADRAGSYGFVLFGTLNKVMEAATRHNRDSNEATFDMYVTMDNLNDMNISDDGNPVTIFTITSLKTKILAAAAAAETAYANGTGDSQWWDVEHDHASLTYHQLQNYILNGGALLPDSSEAGLVNGLTWCHLHKACAALSSTKPKDWNELIQKARSNPSDIALLTATEIETLTHLRADNQGTAFSSPTAFQNAVQAAVAALDGGPGVNTIWSWDEVQATICNEPVANALTDYWWYDGGNKVSDWASLMLSIKDAVVAFTMPDGFTTGTRESKLNTANDTTIIPNILENLAMSGVSGGPTADDYTSVTPYTLSDFNQLKTDLKAAYPAITGLGVTTPTWDQVQYHILKGSVLTTGPDMDTFGSHHFWWFDDGKLVVDEATLIAADKAKQGGRDAAIMQLTAVPLNFKADFKGTDFAATAVDNFRTAVDGVAAAVGSTGSWNDIQYYLIHNKTYKSAEVTAEAGYYWWKGGATSGSMIPIISGNPDNFVAAAFAKVYNNNVNAWADLTSVNMLTNTYFYKPANEATSKSSTSPYADRAAVPKFTSLSDTVVWDSSKTFQDAMESLVTLAVTAEVADTNNLNHGHTPPTLTWYQIQKYLTDGTFVADSAVDKDAYWWLTDNDNPNVPMTHATFDEIMKAVLNYYKSGPTGASRSDAGNIATINFSKLSQTDTSFKRDAAGTQSYTNALTANAAKTRLKAMVNLAANNLTSEAAIKALTWPQIQSALLVSTGAINASANASTYSWAPKWVQKAADGGKATYSAVGDMIPAVAPETAQEGVAAEETAPIVTTETSISDDGLTEFTTVETRTWNSEIYDWDVETVTTSVTTVTVEETTIIVTTVTTVKSGFDLETGEYLTTTESKTTTTTSAAEAAQTEERETTSGEAPSEDVSTPVEPETAIPETFEPAETTDPAEPVETVTDPPPAREEPQTPEPAETAGEDETPSDPDPEPEEADEPEDPVIQTGEPADSAEPIEEETTNDTEPAEQENDPEGGDEPMATSYVWRSAALPLRLVSRFSRGPTENRSPQSSPPLLSLLSFLSLNNRTARRTTA